MHLFEIGKTYTFNTRAPGILGTTLKNARLLSILGYETASLHENIIVKHRAVYPALPSSTPDKPETYIYYFFQSESGEKVIFANVWIDETSIETIDHISFTVTLTRVSLSDIPRVRDAMNALGYRNYEIKQI